METYTKSTEDSNEKTDGDGGGNGYTMEHIWNYTDYSSRMCATDTHTRHAFAKRKINFP